MTSRWAVSEWAWRWGPSRRRDSDSTNRPRGRIAAAAAAVDIDVAPVAVQTFDPSCPWGSRLRSGTDCSGCSGRSG